MFYKIDSNSFVGLTDILFVMTDFLFHLTDILISMTDFSSLLTDILISSTDFSSHLTGILPIKKHLGSYPKCHVIRFIFLQLHGRQIRCEGQLLLYL
ncbi:hypothetical protein J6TS2_16240 [Heyndrickxia sporothermodurans]|nr:hypothetical protein J6TS2_16240 [Heyndrickxia sporothermodurans]